MGIADKAKDKLEQVAGKAKESLGNLTGDEEMRRDGQKDQVVGNVKEVGHDLKDKLTGNNSDAGTVGDVGEKLADASEKAREKLTD